MKRTLLQFVGETRHDTPSYSHGVRQAISQLNNTPGMPHCHIILLQCSSAPVLQNCMSPGQQPRWLMLLAVQYVFLPSVMWDQCLWHGGVFSLP